jgi:hypothetical protein
MKNNVRSAALSALSVLAVLFLVLATTVPALAQASPKPIVIHPTHYGLSRPLRDMVAEDPYGPRMGENTILFLGRGPALPGASGPAGEDKALQREAGPLVGTIPGLNFEGVGEIDGVAPPDTNGSVGLTQYLQTTNFHFAVYDKSNGNLLLGPASLHTIWAGAGGNCGNGSDGGDPAVVFDKAAQRWVISQLAGGYGSWCMAVSQSSDATGAWYQYEFPSGGSLDDYPKIAVWPDAYYRSTNTFGNGQAKACAFDRALMLTGGAANEICFQEQLPTFSLLPADLDGSTPPPSGEPNSFIELVDSTHLGLWLFHVDFTNPNNSTFTGPTNITVNSYTQAGSIPQPPGDGTQLDSLSDRLMFRNAYRNINGTEYLVVGHSVVAGSVVGPRWYQITDPAGTPTVAQQGTYSPDSTYRWMGSLAMDQNGDIALGYSASSSSVHPALRYTGRVPGDPAGTMESEASILEGTGSQTGGLSRWGDYSSMSVDPIDDCTFWYTNEYIPTDGSFNWHTHIASFKFVGCGSTTPDFYLTDTPPSQTIPPGGSTSYSVTVNPVNGYSNTVTLSLSGCPSGATCSISPSSVSPPYNPSTLSVSSTSSLAPGNYTITITGTDGTLTHTTTAILVVTDFTISATPATQTIKKGGSTTYKATVAALNGFGGVITFSVTGLPANTTGTFNPTKVTGKGASTLTIVSTKKSPVGTYTLNITGTSGSVIHKATVKLVIAHHL